MFGYSKWYNETVQLDKLNFVAAWIDPSFMNNKIMADTILEIGGLAPRITFARVRNLDMHYVMSRDTMCP